MAHIKIAAAAWGLHLEVVSTTTDPGNNLTEWMVLATAVDLASV